MTIPPQFGFPSIIKQVVELFLAGVFAVGLGRDAARPLYDIAELIEFAEIILLFVFHQRLDILAALVASGRVEMAATTAATKVGQAVRATVASRGSTFDAGRLSAAPAHQTIGGHGHTSFSYAYNVRNERVPGKGETGREFAQGHTLGNLAQDPAQPDVVWTRYASRVREAESLLLRVQVFVGQVPAVVT